MLTLVFFLSFFAKSWLGFVIRAIGMFVEDFVSQAREDIGRPNRLVVPSRSSASASASASCPLTSSEASVARRGSAGRTVLPASPSELVVE